MANLNFHPNIYDWIVISGAKTKYTGVGTIRGWKAKDFSLNHKTSGLPKEYKKLV